MSLRLIIEDDEGTTTIVPLGKDAITIGRQQGNTIQLTEKNVSRRHARLALDDADAWVIEDLGSYNGVKVNGVAIEGRITLKEGDVVQIGDYHLALTEDVDKRTLNFSGAANDPGAAAAGVEPMLASSSTELPRLSPDEMAMLQSGPQAVSNPMLDSGATPASAGGYEERRKGGSGFLVGFGAVVVIALIIGVVWLASSGGSSETADTAKVASAGETKTAPAKALTPNPPLNPDPPAAPADPSDSAGEEPIEVQDDPPPPDPPDPVPAAEGGDEEVVNVVDDPPPEPVPAPATNNKPKNNRRPPKRNPQNNTPKPTPPKPAVDADALAAEARKLAFSNPKRCFEVAKQSYQAKRSGTVAQLMASCACRMGDAGKAKYAIGKVGPSKREGVVKMCEAKGVKL